MAKTKYSFRNRAVKFHGLTAKQIATQLERIARLNGGKLQVSAIIAEASNPESILHPLFNWDDQKAAHEYRLWQARQLVKTVYVETVESAKPEPVFIHVETEQREGHYRDHRVLVQDIQEFESALAEAKRKLISAQASFNRIRDLAVHAKDDRAALIGVVLEALGTAQMTVQRIQ